MASLWDKMMVSSTEDRRVQNLVQTELEAGDPALTCCCRKKARVVGLNDGGKDGINETVGTALGISDGIIDGISDGIAIG